MHVVAACSEDEEDPEQVFPASLVISSQIPGYNGSKVDTKEMVEVIFHINVRVCFRACLHVARLHIAYAVHSCMHHLYVVTINGRHWPWL